MSPAFVVWITLATAATPGAPPQIKPPAAVGANGYVLVPPGYHLSCNAPTGCHVFTEAALIELVAKGVERGAAEAAARAPTCGKGYAL